jgi:hypothetical protein
MKGKQQFTKRETGKIKRLLNEKMKARRADQKRIRNALRGMGFYISGFFDVVPRQAEGFSADDFEKLIRDGNIVETAN